MISIRKIIPLVIVAVTILCGNAFSIETLKEKQSPLQSGSVNGIINTDNGIWLLDGGSLRRFTLKNDMAVLDRVYHVGEEVIGFDKDRSNIYIITRTSITVFPIKTPNRVIEYSTRDAGLNGDIETYSLGSRLIIASGRNCAIYDGITGKWKRFETEAKTGIRTVMEKYGLIILLTDDTLSFYDVSGKKLSNLAEISDIHKDFKLVDFMMTRNGKTVWLASNKMIMKVNLSGGETPTEFKTYKPYEEPNVSEIRKFFFLKNRFFVVYNDALFEFNPGKESWKCIVAGGLRETGDKAASPTADAVLHLGEGLFTSFFKDDDSITISTTNHGILGIYLEAGREEPRIVKIGAPNGLPTAYIDDAARISDGSILAKTGDGVYRCRITGTESSQCTALLEPSYYRLASESTTGFIEKLVDYGNGRYFIYRNSLYYYDGSGEVRTLNPTAQSGTPQKDKIFDIATYGGFLVLVSNETLYFMDANGVIKRQLALSDIEQGKAFDSIFSTVSSFDDRLVIGMKKKYEVKVEFDDKEPNEKASEKSGSHEDEFETDMAALYLLDKDYQVAGKFDKQDGLFVKSVSKITEGNGKLYVFASDVMTGCNVLFVMKGRKWETVGDKNVYKDYKPEKFFISDDSFQFSNDYNYFAFDGKGALVRTGNQTRDENGAIRFVLKRKEGERWVEEALPASLKTLKGILNENGYQVLLGSGTFIRGGKTGWVPVSDQKIYSILPDAQQSLYLIGGKAPAIFDFDKYVKNHKKQKEDQKWREFAPETFAATRRPRSEIKIIKPGDVVLPEDITYDVGFSLRAPPSEENARAVVESLGWKLVRSDLINNWFEAKVSDPSNIKDELVRIATNPGVVLASPNIYHDTTGKVSFVSDELVLSISPDATSEEIEQLLTKYSLTKLRWIGTSLVVASRSEERLPAVAGKLRNEPSLRSVEMNIIAMAQSDESQPVAPPSDPHFPNQWALKQIGFDKIWNKELPLEATPITIALLDTGVEGGHPDLQGRVINGPNFIDGSMVSADDNGHGTHLAGIIAANTNNGIGISGLCDTCKVLSVKVLDADGLGTYADVAEAIRYVVDSGDTKIINISLSGYGYSDILRQAVEYADENGVLVVSSVGNDAVGSPSFPAAFPTVLAVSATDKNGAQLLDSNFGDYIDMVAPGESILSTYLNGEYRELSGTSLSAAIVSGLAARFISYYQDVSPQEVKGMLYQTADDLGDTGPDPIFGNGRINAEKLFTEQNLLASAAAYYEQYDMTGSDDLSEAPADLDIVAADGWFKKLCNAFKKFLGGIFTFISEVAQKIAREISEGLKALIKEVGKFFDMLYKRILRPILFFYCKAMCPAILTVDKADKAGIIKIAESSPVGAYLSVAAAVCSYGCPSLEAMGIIVPPTRMMCVESDPIYSGPDKVPVSLQELVKDETEGGPYEIHYPDGTIVMVESAVDAIQETFFHGQENPEVEFDGIIFEKKYYDASLLVAEQKCFRVEYNPYSKITKIFNSINQVIDVYSLADNFVSDWKVMEDKFGLALDSSLGVDTQFRYGYEFIDSMRKIATYIPGDAGAQLRENIEDFNGYFVFADKYIFHADDRIRNILESIEETEETISQWNPDSVDYGLTLGSLDGIADLIQQLHEAFSDIDPQKLANGIQDLLSSVENLKDLINSGYDPEDLLDDIKSIRANWEGIRFACNLSDEPMCIKIRGLDLGDLIDGIGKIKLPELPNLDDCFRWPFDKGFCELFGLDGDNGIEVETSSNPFTTQDVEMQVSNPVTGEVVFTESYTPELNQADPLLPSKKTMRWDYRDNDGGRVSPGDYLVSLVFTHFDGRKKEVPLIGQNNITYPSAYPDLTTEEISGAVSETFFQVDAGQEFLVFEYDFGNKRGANNVVEVKLEIYDSNNNLVFVEARQIPYLSDDPNIYDRRFVWNLKDISTGDPVPDGSYTFRLITTMLSSKIYISYFTHDVNRADAVPPGQEPPTEPPSEEPEKAEFTVPPFLGPYEKYLTFQKDAQGKITGATDSFGNKYAFSRDANGEIAGVVYPDGSEIRFATGTNNITTYKDPNGNTLSYTYDSQNRVQSITDPFGRSMTYAYGDGQVTITDAAGRNATMALNEKGLASTLQLPGQPLQEFGYDDNGNLTSVKIGDNQPTAYTYDPAGRMTSMADPLGNRSEYRYDPATGFLTSVRDPRGNETSFTYDERGNILSRTDAKGNTTSYTYDGNNRPLSVTKPDGSVTTYSYDEKGRLKTMTQAGGTTVFTYDEANRVTQLDAMGRTTRIEYDAAGNITKINDPENHSVSAQYNQNGLLMSFTDARGNTTTYEYNGQGRIAAVHQPLGKNMTVQYDSQGNVSAITDALGNTTTYTYDELGRLKTETNPLGGTKSYTYDVDGRITSQMDELGRTTSYEYNPAGNLLKVTHPDGKTESYEYDASGNITSYTDRAGKRTEYEYDEADNMTATTAPGGAQTAFQYDAAGNMTGVTNPAGQSTSYSYNDLGKIESVNDAAGNTSSYNYDPLGNLRAFTDSQGQTNSYSYYGDNNPQAASGPGGETVSYKEYDANGNVARITDGLGNTVQFQYDELNRLTQLTAPNGGVWRYGYDLNGNLTSVTDALGQTTTYEYDVLNRKTQEIRADGVTITYGYDAAGNVTSIQGPHQNITKTYDAMNRLTSLTAEPIDELAPPTYTLSYSFNNLGKLSSVTGPQGTASYDYDTDGSLIATRLQDGQSIFYSYNSQGKLTSITYPNDIVLKVNYDEYGNVSTYEATKDGQEVVPFDSLNDQETQLFDHDREEAISYDEAAQVYENDKFYFRYDANGSLIEKSDKTTGAIYTYSYDSANRLIKVEGPDINAEYFYNGLGERIARIVNESIFKYAYNQNDLLAVYDQNDSINTSYYYGPSEKEVIAMVRDMNEGGNPESYYYLLSQTGNVGAITNLHGVALNSYSYVGSGKLDKIECYNPEFDDRMIYTNEEFMDVTNMLASICLPNNLMYMAGQFDWETQFYNIGAEYISSDLGKYAQSDFVRWIDEHKDIMQSANWNNISSGELLEQLVIENIETRLPMDIDWETILDGTSDILGIFSIDKISEMLNIEDILSPINGIVNQSINSLNLRNLNPCKRKNAPNQERKNKGTVVWVEFVPRDNAEPGDAITIKAFSKPDPVRWRIVVSFKGDKVFESGYEPSQDGFNSTKNPINTYMEWLWKAKTYGNHTITIYAYKGHKQVASASYEYSISYKNTLKPPIKLKAIKIQGGRTSFKVGEKISISAELERAPDGSEMPIGQHKFKFELIEKDDNNVEASKSNISKTSTHLTAKNIGVYYVKVTITTASPQQTCSISQGAPIKCPVITITTPSYDPDKIIIFEAHRPTNNPGKIPKSANPDNLIVFHDCNSNNKITVAIQNDHSYPVLARLDRIAKDRPIRGETVTIPSNGGKGNIQNEGLPGYSDPNSEFIVKVGFDENENGKLDGNEVFNRIKPRQVHAITSADVENAHEVLYWSITRSTKLADFLFKAYDQGNYNINHDYKPSSISYGFNNQWYLYDLTHPFGADVDDPHSLTSHISIPNLIYGPNSKGSKLIASDNATKNYIKQWLTDTNFITYSEILHLFEDNNKTSASLTKYVNRHGSLQYPIETCGIYNISAPRIKMVLNIVKSNVQGEYILEKPKVTFTLNDLFDYNYFGKGTLKVIGTNPARAGATLQNSYDMCTNGNSHIGNVFNVRIEVKDYEIEDISVKRNSSGVVE